MIQHAAGMKKRQSTNVILYRRYCKTDGREINWDLIKLALQSSADIAVIPFQDVIGLGSEGRMNFPGTIEGNWEWRFTSGSSRTFTGKPAL